MMRRDAACGMCLVWWMLATSASAEPADVSGPQWIWGSVAASEGAEVGYCDFRRSFQTTEVRSAVLKIACDNRYVLRLNGRLVGIGDDWQQWDAYDVTALVRDGKNEVWVRCQNDGGPAGLAVDLAVDSMQGDSWQMVSDGQWQAKLQRDGTWDPTVEARTPWSAAVSAGRVGQVEPWGGSPAPPAETRVIERVAQMPAEGPFQLRDGDRVLFVGNTLIERAQRFGYFEAALTTAFPERDVAFRNLGWSGDTVFGEARARFGRRTRRL